MRILHAVSLAAAAAVLQGCCINDCIGIFSIAARVGDGCAQCLVVAPPSLEPGRLMPQAELPKLQPERAVAGPQQY